MSALLEVSGLKTQFRTEDGIVRAVDDVSFSLDKGETLGIVGESGSGKSITSLSIMRLIPKPGGEIAAGRIVFGGTDLLGLDERQMRAVRGKRIAMIFQDPMTSLNPVLTIGHQLTEALQLHLKLGGEAARKRAIELLRLVGVPAPEARLKDYPHQFSGGMRQRVMIAMAISCEPELLIADEPTTALDVTIQAQILELIRRLQEEMGTAVMIITHDLGVVAGVADRVAVMYAGKIVEEGPAREILKFPRMPYTIGLLRSMPRIDDDPGRHLEPIKGAPPDLASVTDAACPFAPRCDYFVAGTCDRARPPLREVGAGHRAACFFDVTIDTPVPVRAEAES